MLRGQSAVLGGLEEEVEPRRFALRGRNIGLEPLSHLFSMENAMWFIKKVSQMASS